nr:mitotic spindle assembly checkpoint protein MAD1 isoform X1 [Loxodonta africana]
MDRMTCSVERSHHLSPVTPVIDQWAHEQSGHGGRDGGYAWVQQHGLPLTKADSATTTLERPGCQQQRPTLSPQYATIPRGDQRAAWWQVNYIGPLPLWKWQHFVLTRIDTYSGYIFAFPTCDASAKTTICELTECLIHIMVSHTLLPQIKEHNQQSETGMRAILGSYDSELTPAEYSPQLTRRIREAEDMVQKVHAHSSEIEAQLSQALEELGDQKQRADTLEMELKLLKSQADPADQSFLFSREEVDTLRLKIEELEGERRRLEEEKKTLEMQLEKLTLQGDYDQSRTKVLHLRMNPASAARQRLRENQVQLQEECERLRELVHTLERGGAVPADLEGTAGLPSAKEVAELKKQVESAELKNQRLKEVFQTKIQEFRKVCYTLTGYQIDITTENQYRLTSMYAEHKADCLLFKATGPSGAKMQLLETEFSRTVGELIELHLLRQDSIPAFLSSLTLDLFSRQTVA